MAHQLSVAVRNAQAGALETTVGAGARLQIRSGAQPANCGAADTGTLLCEMTLPGDWLTNPSNGTVAKNGTWAGTAVASGTAGHFRIKDAGGATTHMQGSVTVAGAGGDMLVDNTSIAAGQAVSVTSFGYTRGYQ